ncbi:tetratricopeptide repeat protein 12 [Leptinotarsa decemlineata]|uniref:tetratricopeptide repeat protein 12 n=1 Tax=Leptinotarsa decemlineata TaxID=7539 RepID=UPI003D30AB9B
MEKLDELGKQDEEFNNFMLRVNEVGSIVKKLASKDERLQEIGNLEAKKYLGETSEKIIENINSEKIVLKIRNNRTLINKKSCEKNDTEISQETFMDEVSQDAERRYKNKLVRTEKMETFKKQATLAFRRGEFEKALTLYNKAIEQIKDSCLLYNNRALTYMNLKLYEKSRDDLKWALRINENCLKSLLLLAKINFLENKMDEFDKILKEALERNPQNEKFIKITLKD